MGRDTLEMMSIQSKAAEFWAWFVKHEEELKKLLDGSQSEALASLVNPALDKVEKGVGWELGPGQGKPYMFSVCSSGEKKRPTPAQLLVKYAPTLDDWEIFDSRQARSFHDRFHLVGEDLWVSPGTWKFAATENIDAKRLDIVIVAEEFENLKPETRDRAVFIALDTFLGEQVVEEWIAGIEMYYSDTEIEGLRPLTELDRHVKSAQKRFREMSELK